ncbi:MULTISPECIES: bifunctional phosphoribosylaminoimidazolecarboxamide formyltransferase/IMP cyclohydrolase [unclassified Arcicella]|uniref:bifunctional phosphoribosylaminoimidazolecarboxamide formyltransferase/IMP cyclohydrolase n=1 Tax=unclassified Arcicella TaxID=2644986 RepID=UPI0028601849|nr:MULTISPECIES: bifunctional phosphoribosylaminoimidazolecarboxamide formyltransferase/IMP cyclohydrolase [unclassified Arcicella]MDR6560433.1 phosphoribosylaminoimidazolecarboxamide formyltransferase/IMP cyclohydrolase [Arcicella sp. BE51]MDR6809961.1 phosphoribosylaminoimidazolecarboxamide formyltransferase/IMP cyclohydrolase [Arcicella sp. BE140]MDR6821310.1 phosphoribosylaminoimidazolecarboxamide formyltransferase/IMP cyclohydrolase [Arcicella sp. BE139]
MSSKKIQSALISVYYKDGLAPIVELLHQNGVKLYSTGGTQTFIEELGIPVTAVEDLTSYPSIFGGRVKTLHPKVFGGILYRRDHEGDVATAAQYEIPSIDLVIVDLYPFEETVASGASEDDIIEKIDIGGISLIRGAAKNFNDVLIVSSRTQYAEVLSILQAKNCSTDLLDRKRFAMLAFGTSSHYDTAIHAYFNGNTNDIYDFKSLPQSTLRYGENPHQSATFYGDIDALFDKLHGKELSYNNLVDVDACITLLDEFKETSFVIIKHTNACGVASAETVHQAYLNAFSCDTISAFGGVLATNGTVDKASAEEMNSLFFEILIAPDFTEEALTILKSKKNRILLKRKPVQNSTMMFKTLLNGVLEQDKDLATETVADFKTVTTKAPTDSELRALEFALKICKHTKSNTIILAKEGQLLASGVGQTSRVDALKQAIDKAAEFGFDLQGSVMASDAFFPFPDCVEIAHKAGITAVVQPGGSIKDKDSIAYCDANDLAMVMTGVRHFKH